MVLATHTVEIPMQGPKTEQTKEGERGKSTNTDDNNIKHQGFLVLFYECYFYFYVTSFMDF